MLSLQSKLELSNKYAFFAAKFTIFNIYFLHKIAWICFWAFEKIIHIHFVEIKNYYIAFQRHLSERKVFRSGTLIVYKEHWHWNFFVVNDRVLFRTQLFFKLIDSFIYILGSWSNCLWQCARHISIPLSSYIFLACDIRNESKSTICDKLKPQINAFQ